MNTTARTIACTLAAISAASAICAAAPRMDRSKLLIGAYCLQANARTEAHVKAIRECGVDFIVGVGADDRSTLDLFAKHGVGAIVNGVVPGWWGGDGENAGKLREKNPPDVYSKGAATLKDHPAIWAIDIGDEPSALDFPYYGEVVRQLNRELPGVPLYLNLYPNYASVTQNTGKQTVNQLGTPTYAEHVAEYCRHVPLDYISYDFYPYVEPAGADRFLSKYYDNFILVADACRHTGRGFWYIPQVNSREGQPPTSENRLRFQACAAMSFGAETITWACWTAGWWTNNVLDAAGVPTAQYAKLKKVNAELKRLGPEYMKFRSTATHFVGFASGSPRNPKEPMPYPAALDAGFFKGVRASNGAPLLVGEMSARDPSSPARALFVTAADDPEDAKPASFEVIFRAPGTKAYGSDGPVPVKILPDGSCSVPLRSCHGILLVSGE
jgi:hypothetical protein